MKIETWINLAAEKLKAASIPTPKLDAEILLADELNKDRSWLHAHPEFAVQGESLYSLNEQIERRMGHEPLAYIRGKQEFYGRDFKVSADTLTPRPETETLVELALEVLSKNTVDSVADIGTGSGCIVISLYLESTAKTKFAGYDISKRALKIASDNAKIMRANVDFFQDDLKSESKHQWQDAGLIVANLPYVPADFNINLAASHEPEFAIFGGKDGLDYYRSMFEKINGKTEFVITESMPPQHQTLKQIAENTGFRLSKSQDFIQLFVRTRGRGF